MHRFVFFFKKLLLLATVNMPYIYIYISVGSGDFGFGVSIPLASPHRRRTAFFLPLVGLSSVGRSLQRCGYVGADRSCQLQYWFAQSYWTWGRGMTSQSQSMLVCMLIKLCKQEILSLLNFRYKELEFQVPFFIKLGNLSNVPNLTLWNLSSKRVVNCKIFLKQW